MRYSELSEDQDDLAKLQVWNDPAHVRQFEPKWNNYNCELISWTVKKALGADAKVYGFADYHNPGTKYFDGDDEDGHHFCVFKARYIVDPWMLESEGRSVFDLKNPEDAGLIKSLYGDRKKWVCIKAPVIEEADDANRLKPVIDKLRTNPLAPHIRVFGSYIVPGSSPKDVDVFVDLDAAGTTVGAQTLLKIAQQHYGDLDPFILVKGVLYTRDAEATTWVRAKNAKGLLAAGRKGKPLMKQPLMTEAMTPDEREEEKEFWLAVAPRYTKDQLRLLKAFSKANSKSSRVWFHNLIPQWFEGAAPLKGFANIPAPTMDPESKAKFEALYHYAKSGNDRSNQYAALYANAFLIEACFPEEVRRRLPPMKEVFDFDPRANDIGSIVDAWRLDMSSKPVAACFDMRALDCVRICGNDR